MLDDSLSMAGEKSQQSLFQRAQSELVQLLSPADAVEFGLWTTATAAQDQLSGSSLDSDHVRATIQRLKSPQGSSATIATLQAGLQALKGMRQPYRQLVLASDFQASQWRTVSDSQLQAIRQQLTAEGSRIQLTLLVVGPADSTANLAAEVLDPSPLSTVNTEYRLSARIINHGSEPIEGVPVRFVVDGQPLANHTLTLAAQASEQVEFACEFKEPGWHSLAIGVDDPSQVHGDDWCFAVVQVTPPQRILVVDDSLSSEQIARADFIGTSRYLKLALAPLDDVQGNLYSMESITSSALAARELDGIAAVIVADAAQVGEAPLRQLADYVQSGGSLLCFPPESTTGDDWKPIWNTMHDGAQPWLPLSLIHI